MRAYFDEDIDAEQDTISVVGIKHHHLANVTRVKLGQEILVLNGRGLRAKSRVVDISKKEMKLEIYDKTITTKSESFVDIAFGKVKKDSIESCIRSCVELGVSNIYILESEFSQNYELKDKRINAILRSAMEQSNNPFLPQVHLLSFEEIDLDFYNSVILASNRHASKNKTARSGKELVLIGPEGGFSIDEERLIMENKNIITCNLGSSILRTQTAIPAVIGYVLARAK